MSEESFYSNFQTIAGDEVEALIAKVGSPKWLAFSKGRNAFMQRAIPRRIFSKFDKIAYLDAFKTPFTSSGIVCCFCLNTPEDIIFAVETLALLDEFEKHLFVVPRITTLCQEIIERAHLKKLSLMEAHLDVIPLDPYSFIVPAPDCFGKCFVESDISDIYTIARSMLKIQLIKGVPSRIFTAGSMSSRVYELMEQQKLQIGSNFLEKDGEIDDLFIIDRTCDLATPLVTQMTYGGYIDDRFDVDFGTLKLPKGVTLRDLNGKEQSVVLLSDNSDGVFAETRSLSMGKAADAFAKLQCEISQIQDQMKDASAFSQWVVHKKRAERLLEMKPLISMHLDLSIRLGEMSRLDKKSFNFEYDMLIQEDSSKRLITQMINNGRILDGIRLMCLASVTSEGVAPKLISDIQRRMMAVAGFDAAEDFINLDKCGLLKSQSGIFGAIGQIKKWTAMAKALKLVLPADMPNKTDMDGNDLGPADVGESYNQYVPTVVRLVQSGVEGKWEPGEVVDTLLSKINIPHSVHQSHSQQSSDRTSTRRVLVFVIGGVTASECAIFGQLGKVIFDDEVEFHIGSTSVITGKRLLKEICPKLAKIEAQM